MKRLVVAIICCLIALPLGAETIDRVVATVNGRPVLHSDVDETVRYEAFIERKPLTQITQADLQATLQRLIDQELLRQQMGEMTPEISRETIDAKVAEIEKQYGGAPEQWRKALAAYSLDESSFLARLENQLRTLAFIDSRLRPSILVDGSAVDTYYREKLLPQLQKAGASRAPALSDVQHEIREILTQQRIDDVLATWLRNLRQQSHIRLMTDEAQVASRGAPRADAK